MVHRQRENGASVIPTLHLKHLFLHCVTWTCWYDLSHAPQTMAIKLGNVMTFFCDFPCEVLQLLCSSCQRITGGQIALVVAEVNVAELN